MDRRARTRCRTLNCADETRPSQAALPLLYTRCTSPVRAPPGVPRARSRPCSELSLGRPPAVNSLEAFRAYGSPLPFHELLPHRYLR